MTDVLDDLQLRKSEAAQRMQAFAAKVEARSDGWTATDRKAFDALDATYKEIAERLDELTEARADAASADRQRAPFEKIVRSSGPSTKNDTTEYRAGNWLAGELRALVGSGTTGGGAVTPPGASTEFFDLLAASSVGLRAGFKQIRTDRDALVIPRLTADVGASWTAEAAPITQTSLTADQLTATPRKLAGIERLSNEVIADSIPAVLDTVAQSLVRSISLKFDLAMFEGSGVAPEPRGLKNTSGITTVSAGVNGSIPTSLDFWADAIGAIEAANANATAIFMHPRTWKTLLKVKEVSGSAKPIMQDSAGSGAQGVVRAIYGVPVFLSSQISTTETQGTAAGVASSSYVTQSDRCVAVLRSDVRVERDSSRLFNSDESEVRAIMRGDFVVPNPTAVVRVLGILA